MLKPKLYLCVLRDRRQSFSLEIEMKYERLRLLNNFPDVLILADIRICWAHLEKFQVVESWDQELERLVDGSRGRGFAGERASPKRERAEIGEAAQSVPLNEGGTDVMVGAPHLTHTILLQLSWSRWSGVSLTS